MSEVNWQERVKALIDAEKYEEAIALLSSIFKKHDHPDYYLYLGLIYLLKQDKEKANESWLVGSINSSNIENFKVNLLNLLESCSFTFANQRKLDQVRTILDIILEIQEDYQNPDLDKIIAPQLESLYNLGISYVQNKQYIQAESNFKEILSFLMNDSLTWYNLSALYYEINQINDAQMAVKNAISNESWNANYWHLLGLIYTKKGEINNAIEAYYQSLKLDPNFFDALNNLGNSYKQLKQFSEAEKYYKKAIQINPRHCGTYANLGNLFIIQKKYQQSLEIYNQAYQLTQLTPELFDGWMEALNCIGKTREAKIIGEKALELFPDDLFLFRKYHLLLPIIYQNSQEIEYYRQCFEEGLDLLIDHTQLKTSHSISSALKTIYSLEESSQNNFYLTYQGKNDTKIQKKYGDYSHLIMNKAYANFTHLPKLPSKTVNKIKIGYISTRLHKILGKLTLGWLKFADREKFKIYSYNISYGSNELHEGYQIYSDCYYQLTSSLEKIVNQIVINNLDILVFVDIGMDSIMGPLACFRLAPIQCTTWGHPITSGLPTIDYFISSELMEPENGKEHYSETLIKLPNIAMSYEKPQLYPITLTRQDFGLRTNSVVYLCCQSIFKYLPQYDYIFAEIASQVKNSQFVFLESNISQELNDIFKGRIKKHFDSLDLNFEHHVLFLPFLNEKYYSIVNQLSDIFLDTFSWSGGITTLKAIACGLPVVTCPGEFMRGRHSYGILRMLGVRETIAEAEKQYINIAVRLGLDQQWRKEIRHNIQNSLSRVYNDQECVKALEKFYLEVAS